LALAAPRATAPTSHLHSPWLPQRPHCLLLQVPQHSSGTQPSEAAGQAPMPAAQPAAESAAEPPAQAAPAQVSHPSIAWLLIAHRGAWTAMVCRSVMLCMLNGGGSGTLPCAGTLAGRAKATDDLVWKWAKGTQAECMLALAAPRATAPTSHLHSPRLPFKASVHPCAADAGARHPAVRSGRAGCCPRRPACRGGASCPCRRAGVRICAPCWSGTACGAGGFSVCASRSAHIPHMFRLRNAGGHAQARGSKLLCNLAWSQNAVY
jgi:hypothetical protein